MMKRSILLILLGLACTDADFRELERNATYIRLDAPGGFDNSGLGAVIETYSYSGGAESRIVASSGPGSGHVVFESWSANQAGSFEALFDGCDDNQCEAATGGSLASVPTFRGAEGCLATISTRPLNNSNRVEAGVGVVRVQCEASQANYFVIGGGPSGPQWPQTDLGIGAASLPAGHPSGSLLLSATALGGDIGSHLIAMREDSAGDRSGQIANVQIDAPDFPIDTGMQTPGLALRTQPISDSEADGYGAAVADIENPVLIAMTTRATSGARMDRVRFFVFGRETTDGRTVDIARQFACIDNVRVRPTGRDYVPDAIAELVELGGSLELGTRDGGSFVAVSTEVGSTVALFDLAALPQDGTCADGQSPPAGGVIRCDEPGLCGGFGIGLGLVDLDGDGDDEIAIGSPTANTQITAQSELVSAGRVLLYESEGSFQSSSAPSDLSENARFGQAIAGVPSASGREELVIGAPGNSRLYVHVCTGLSGDADMNGETCFPRGE